MMRARTAAAAAIAVSTLACGGAATGPGSGEPAAGVVASFDGGSVSFAEVEGRAATARTPACRAARQAPGGGSVEELLPCYRESAEALALERLVLAGIPDLDRALEGLGERYTELRRRAYLLPYYQKLRDEIEVDDEDIEAHFAAHRESYRRPSRLTLWNIFRRHEDPDAPETTDAFLEGLKERYEAGEPFAALARQYSQSETRSRDGLVGPIEEGKLPARLEKIAFSLGDGELSDPIRVRGGSVLLQVRGVAPGVEPDLESMRQRVRLEIVQQKIEAEIDRRLAGSLPPPPEPGEPADEEAQREARERRQELLLQSLMETADEEARREAEASLREEGGSLLVDQELEAEMWKLVDADPDALAQYYEDNRAQYQAPLRFRLVAWDLPFGDDPPRQLERMEQLREELAAGQLELEAAAEELGGSIRELGWRGFEELADEIPNKAHAYLLQIEGSGYSVSGNSVSGYSVAYQQDEALHLLKVEERAEPRPLAYDEVRERVRDDYFERFRQRLYADVAQARLTAAGFVFHDAEVRRLLAPPAEAGASEPDPATAGEGSHY